MTVRLKIALTILATGLITAVLLIATVLVAFERFEHETTFQRSGAFLARVNSTFDNLLDLHDRQPQEFNAWLRNLVLYEPDTQLYLLDAEGTVLSSTGKTLLPPGFKVALAPLKAAVAATQGEQAAPYVMGDDPERMDADAVIAAVPLRRAVIRNDEPVSGYLYLVCHKAELPTSRWEAVRRSFALPALAAIVSIVALTSLLAWLVIASITRPLRRLTQTVSGLSANGLEASLESLPDAPPAAPATAARDEFGQLSHAFDMMLATLRKQWVALRGLDHFRREGVSNLSHDLRSPLTATVACLETLDGRWAGDTQRSDDRRLVEVALRNTRNAARLVQSLGDLAKLDEPQFKLHAALVDAGELIDDIQLRFAQRAAQQGVELRAEHPTAPLAPPFASLDIELFERAVANLVDNALKFCGQGTRISLAAEVVEGMLRVCVKDTGPGIAERDLPHLFDRFYQSRHSVAPATGDGGKGLGLAIVKRIAELHGGQVTVRSQMGVGTHVTISVPASAG
jgi:signal transduction histidine kinase